MKRAIVTGGTRGIGRAIVEKLILEGYFVYFTYIKGEQEARQIEALHHNQCKGSCVNGAYASEVESFFAQVLEEGNVETLINNAGISDASLIENTSWEQFKEVLDTNLGGVYNFSKALLPSMKKSRYGNIINISSQASTNVRVGNALYGTSKMAIDRFSQSLYMEVARFNIAVNVISPSFVVTDMTRELFEANRHEILKQIPSRKITELEDITDMIVYLLSRKPTFMGANIPVGGK